MTLAEMLGETKVKELKRAGRQARKETQRELEARVDQRRGAYQAREAETEAAREAELSKAIKITPGVARMLRPREPGNGRGWHRARRLGLD